MTITVFTKIDYSEKVVFELPEGFKDKDIIPFVNENVGCLGWYWLDID